MTRAGWDRATLCTAIFALRRDSKIRGLESVVQLSRSRWALLLPLLMSVSGIPSTLPLRLDAPEQTRGFMSSADRLCDQLHSAGELLRLQLLPFNPSWALWCP